MAIVSRKLKFMVGRLTLQTQFPRLSSYYSSPFREDVGDVNRKFEVTKVPEEWKYVQRVLPLSVVPEPIKKEKYPSGWKPQGENLKDQPYFIQRTKNHMLPVYMILEQKNIRKHTKVKHIQGDIWLLEKELRQFLQKDSFQPIRSQVNELAAFIKFNGDHVNAIKYWLEQKQF